VRGHRHPLEVSELQRRFPVRRRQSGVRLPPRLAPEGRPAVIERMLSLGHGDRLSPSEGLTGIPPMPDTRPQATRFPPPLTTSAEQPRPGSPGAGQAEPGDTDTPTPTPTS